MREMTGVVVRERQECGREGRTGVVIRERQVWL